MIIIASFTILAFYENESSLIGNSINLAGKNRFLAVYSFYEFKEILSDKDNQNPMHGFDSLEKNLLLLKEGGIESNIILNPIPEEFLLDFIKLEEQFNEYKNLAMLIVDSSQKFTDKTYFELDQSKNDFLYEANFFVNKLSQHQKFLSERLLIFQISLMFLNIGIHLLIILFIIKIFRGESTRLLKLEKLSTIGELSARIAHELRNPLSTIKMGLELIKNKENLSSSSHEKLKMIDSAIFRMTHQIDDVLDYVRTTPLNSTRCKIDEIIEESIIRSNLPETIRVEFEKSSVEVECDKEKIIIVFVNLFKNAKEAMNGKGELIIKIKSLPQNLQIIIENSGPPIPSKNLDSIFLPLFTTKSTGTGLGLATCKSIISQHNGTILVVNDPTRFVITIPQKT